MPPEALVPFAIFILAFSVYLAARNNVANAANRDATTHLPRLKLHRCWLQERLQLAEQENWDASMRTRILEELATVEAQLKARDDPR